MAKNDVRSGKIDIKDIVASGELEGTAEIGGGLSENQIVVYQPDSVMRLEVRFDGETVWLPQPQIAELFSCSVENVRLHLKNIYAIGELDKAATSKESLEVRREGMRNVTRKFVYYNLDAIISIGYRVNSIVGVRFRQWATRVIKDRMLAGTVQAAQFAVIDRRLAVHDRDIAELKNKVDFLVQTQTPPLQGVFYNGQLWDARVFVERLIASAKRSLLLIDNWATAAGFDYPPFTPSEGQMALFRRFARECYRQI